MTQQHPTPNHAPNPSVRAVAIPSRMGRLLGAWRARRVTLAASTQPEQTSQRTEPMKTEQESNDKEQPPVEWALRLMM